MNLFTVPHNLYTQCIFSEEGSSQKCDFTHGLYLTPIFNTSSGVYRLEDVSGKTRAIFKPESERNWGPENPYPNNRRSDYTNEDVYFHMLSSFEQGQTAARQHLASLIDFGHVARIPNGFICELESIHFTDLHAEQQGTPKQPQHKYGYLQEWVQNATTLSDYNKEYDNLTEHPLLFEIDLEEYQKIAILDLLLFNEDRHMGNILVTHDETGKPHLVPIDMDAILPYKLNACMNWLLHPRASEPLSQQAKEWINTLNPELLEQLAINQGLIKEVAQNLKVLALFIQKASEHDFTLAEITNLISIEKEGESSILWKFVQEARLSAVNSFSSDLRDRYKYSEHLRWLLWANGKNALSDEEQQWWNSYNKNHRIIIEQKIADAFWEYIRNEIKDIFTINPSQ